MCMQWDVTGVCSTLESVYSDEHYCHYSTTTCHHFTACHWHISVQSMFIVT